MRSREWEWIEPRRKESIGEGKRGRRIEEEIDILKTEQIQEMMWIANSLGVKLVLFKSDKGGGYYDSGKRIYIDPKKADKYTVLHEIGHALYGYGCCTEHDEFVAHGFALALAKINKIKLRKASKDLIYLYAGWSSRKACGAIEINKEKQKKMK